MKKRPARMSILLKVMTTTVNLSSRTSFPRTSCAKEALLAVAATKSVSTGDRRQGKKAEFQRKWLSRGEENEWRRESGEDEESEVPLKASTARIS
jgi:hypothetical protein